MSKETSRESSTQNRVGELSARLCKASELSKRFRYSRALQVLEQLLDQHSDEGTVEEVLKAAKALRSNIKKRRYAFHARLTIVLLFILSVLFVSILHFFRISSTEIIAELETRGIYLELAHDSAIESNPLDSIILYDIEQLVMYADAVKGLNADNSERTIATALQEDIDLNPNEPIMICTDGGSGTLRISGKDLRLQRLELYRDVPVYIQSAGYPNPTVTIRQSANKAFGVIDTGSDIYIECSSCEIHQSDKKPIATPERFRISLSLQELQFSGKKRPVDVALVLLPTDEMEQKNAISEVLHLSKVDFTGSDLGNPVSLIRAGVIKLTELDNQKLLLSESEFFIAEGLTNFQITQLALSNPIHLRLQGNVRSLKSGLGTVLFSRMPSLLEWLLKNEPLNLFVAAASSVFAFLLAAFLRLRIISKD